MKMKKIFIIALTMLFLSCFLFSQGFKTYTAEELAKMTPEEKEQYYKNLQEAINNMKNEINNIKNSGNTSKSDIEKVKSEISNLDSEYNNLKARTSELKSYVEKSTGIPYDVFITLPTTYVSQKGDNFQKIAAKKDIYDDKNKWGRLWRANRNSLKKKSALIYTDKEIPYLSSKTMLKPGQELKILRGRPKFHTVVKGESLWKISGYWEIYNDPTQWPKIYEANKDKIKDPDLIYPKQVFSIPREW